MSKLLHDWSMFPKVLSETRTWVDGLPVSRWEMLHNGEGQKATKEGECMGGWDRQLGKFTEREKKSRTNTFQVACITELV